MKNTRQKILREQLVITNQKQLRTFKSTNNVASHTDSSPLLNGQLPFPEYSSTDINYSRTDMMSPRNNIKILKDLNIKENRRDFAEIC